MQISDLLIWGVLDNSIDTDGFLSFRVNRFFQEEFLEKKDLFLIFTNHRVRYVTIDKVKLEKKYKLKLIEKDVVGEIIESNSVQLAIPYSESRSEISNGIYIDSAVLNGNSKIGTIIDFFHNGFYDVFIIRLLDGKEIMIPDVEKFVFQKNMDEKFIEIRDCEELISL